MSRCRSLLWLSAVSSVTAMLTTPAFAEVCDKVAGKNWTSEQGPVWMFNPGFPFMFVVLVAGLAFVFWRRVPWAGYAVAAILVLQVAAVVVADVIPQHEAYVALLREGCRSVRTDLFDAALRLVLAGAYGLLGYRNAHLPTDPVNTTRAA